MTTPAEQRPAAHEAAPMPAGGPVAVAANPEKAADAAPAVATNPAKRQRQRRREVVYVREVPAQQGMDIVATAKQAAKLFLMSQGEYPLPTSATAAAEQASNATPEVNEAMAVTLLSPAQRGLYIEAKRREEFEQAQVANTYDKDAKPYIVVDKKGFPRDLWFTEEPTEEQLNAMGYSLKGVDQFAEIQAEYDEWAETRRPRRVVKLDEHGDPTYKIQELMDGQTPRNEYELNMDDPEVAAFEAAYQKDQEARAWKELEGIAREERKKQYDEQQASQAKKPEGEPEVVEAEASAHLEGAEVALKVKGVKNGKPYKYNNARDRVGQFVNDYVFPWSSKTARKVNKAMLLHQQINSEVKKQGGEELPFAVKGINRNINRLRVPALVITAPLSGAAWVGAAVIDGGFGVGRYVHKKVGEPLNKLGQAVQNGVRKIHDGAMRALDPDYYKWKRDQGTLSSQQTTAFNYDAPLSKEQIAELVKEAQARARREAVAEEAKRLAEGESLVNTESGAREVPQTDPKLAAQIQAEVVARSAKAIADQDDAFARAFPEALERKRAAEKAQQSGRAA